MSGYVRLWREAFYGKLALDRLIARAAVLSLHLLIITMLGAVVVLWRIRI